MLKSESYIRGLIFSGGLNLAAKGIGFFNSLILAYYFGATAATDIYFCILSVAVLITSTINGIDYLVLIPEAMRIRESQDEKQSQYFLNFFIWLYAGLGLLIAIIIALAPVFFFTLFSKFDSGQLHQNSRLLYAGGVIIVFQLLNNLLNAVLVSYKYFTIPIITNLINSLFAIALTVAFHRQLGISGTIYGIATGFVLNFVLLVLLMKRYLHWNFLHVARVAGRRIWRNIGLMQVNILPVWLRSYIGLYLLSGLGQGIITSVNLGQLLASLPEVFILSQVASVAGIKFSELSAQKNYTDTGRLLENLLNALFVLLIPIAITFAVCSQEIISLAFERGRFDNQSAQTTAYCFFFFALLLPSKIYDIILTRLFTSFQVYGLSTLFAVIAHFIITGLTYAGITWYGLAGFFSAQLAGYYLIMPLVFYLILRFRFQQVPTRGLFRNFLLAMAVLPAVYLACWWLHGQLQVNVFLNIGIIFITALALVLCIAYYVLDLKYFCAALQQGIHKIKTVFSK